MKYRFRLQYTYYDMQECVQIMYIMAREYIGTKIDNFCEPSFISRFPVLYMSKLNGTNSFITCFYTVI